jgi:hypothetical protein
MIFGRKIEVILVGQNSTVRNEKLYFLQIRRPKPAGFADSSSYFRHVANKIPDDVVIISSFLLIR